MAYSLKNICTKYYWNRTATVKIIEGGWVVSFLETQCNFTSSFSLQLVYIYNIFVSQIITKFGECVGTVGVQCLPLLFSFFI